MEARLNSDEWSGNVRELRNYAKQMVLGLRHDQITEPSPFSLSEQMDRFEDGVIRATLDRCNGDVGAASALLQLPRRSLYARLQKLAIDASTFRKRD
jgi:two-component system C4-dicarboxylate transport response regulator DctD